MPDSYSSSIAGLISERREKSVLDRGKALTSKPGIDFAQNKIYEKAPFSTSAASNCTLGQCHRVESGSDFFFSPAASQQLLTSAARQGSVFISIGESETATDMAIHGKLLKEPLPLRLAASEYTHRPESKMSTCSQKQIKAAADLSSLDSAYSNISSNSDFSSSWKFKMVKSEPVSCSVEEKIKSEEFIEGSAASYKSQGVRSLNNLQYPSSLT